jgi:hypothetical protein
MVLNAWRKFSFFPIPILTISHKLRNTAYFSSSSWEMKTMTFLLSLLGNWTLWRIGGILCSPIEFFHTFRYAYMDTYNQTRRYFVKWKKKKKKGKSYPCNRPWRPIVLWDVGASTFCLEYRLIDGGKVVRLTHQPPFTPRKIPGTHFC